MRMLEWCTYPIPLVLTWSPILDTPFDGEGGKVSGGLLEGWELEVEAVASLQYVFKKEVDEGGLTFDVPLSARVLRNLRPIRWSWSLLDHWDIMVVWRKELRANKVWLFSTHNVTSHGNNQQQSIIFLFLFWQYNPDYNLSLFLPNRALHLAINLRTSWDATVFAHLEPRSPCFVSWLGIQMFWLWVVHICEPLG